MENYRELLLCGAFISLGFGAALLKVCYGSKSHFSYTVLAFTALYGIMYVGWWVFQVYDTTNLIALTVFRATFLLGLTQSWIFGFKYLDAGRSCTKEQIYFSDRFLIFIKWACICLYFVVETTLLVFSFIYYDRYNISHHTKGKFYNIYMNLCGS